MTKIYYFSGTGNSLWSANQIAHGITASHPDEICRVFDIGIEARKKNIVIEADSVVFVFPSYAYGLPLIVRRFTKNASFNTRYFAAFVTYGSSPLGTLGILNRILKKKKIGKMYFGKIPSVENYLAIFGPPDEKLMNERLSMQEKATEEAVNVVLRQITNKVNTFCPFSSFVSCLFSIGIKIFYRFYKVSGDCNGCGICAITCPVGAVEIKNGKPVFLKNCEHCQGCVNMCPLRVIKFGRVKFGTRGYRHPKIDISQLTRQT